MLFETMREAPVGQLLRLLTKNKMFKYEEEREGFVLPEFYTQAGLEKLPTRSSNAPKAAAAADEKPPVPDQPHAPGGTAPNGDATLHSKESYEDLTKTSSSSDDEKDVPPGNAREPVGINQNLETATSHRDLENALEHAETQNSLGKKESLAVAPTRLDDGTVLVDWYTTDDPDNPQNWTLGKKSWATFQIGIYTLAVYMGSAIYTPSEPGVMAQFGVNSQLASMGLSMYVLAYGLGPMLWSPLSEIPNIGRNPPYVITFAIFVILTVPTALVENFPGLIVLRFLLGFFGSPCLATGGASLQDMFSFFKLPYVISLWALSATGGPALGPMISGFSVVKENWHWSAWEMLWLAGPVWLFMFFTLPETNPSTILLRRAQRLRRFTGNPNFKAQSELDQANMKVTALILENIYRPNQMMVLDPAVGFTALYTALIYGIYYSFFEAFPLVYQDQYHFSLGEMGLAFLSIIVGVVIALVIYWSYIYWIVEPEMAKNGLGAPERRLIPALFFAWLPPIGMFIFGWTGREDVYWIVSVIGIVIFTVGVFILIQCIFTYLPMTYPQYAASLSAGNDFVRSTLACGAIHFSAPMYRNLGVGPGCSIMGGLMFACVGGVYVLYFFGDRLRARSKFAVK